jgi:hypothetical protein
MASNVPAGMTAIRLTFIAGKVLKKNEGQGWRTNVSGYLIKRVFVHLRSFNA